MILTVAEAEVALTGALRPGRLIVSPCYGAVLRPKDAVILRSLDARSANRDPGWPAHHTGGKFLASATVFSQEHLMITHHLLASFHVPLTIESEQALTKEEYRYVEEFLAGLLNNRSAIVRRSFVSELFRLALGLAAGKLTTAFEDDKVGEVAFQVKRPPNFGVEDHISVNIEDR